MNESSQAPNRESSCDSSCESRLNALGYVEVIGFAAAVVTADAMVKSAHVRLIRQLLRDAAQITLVVDGELAACQAAVDAGKMAATAMQALVASAVMGRPASDTGAFVLRLAEAGRSPFGEPPALPVAVLPATQAAPAKKVRRAARPAEAAAKVFHVKEESVDAEIISIIQTMTNGRSLGQLRAAMPTVAAELLSARLASLCSQGKLVKRHGRFYLRPDANPQAGQQVKPA